MILSDKEIRKYVQTPGAPLIDPFSESQLQAASYDISMSGSIVILKGIGRIIDPANDDTADDMYEEIKIDNEGYLFSPGEYLLVELAETVKIPDKLVAHIRPRTRFTRAGILVADQHCNPTYEGKLHIGLRNVGPNTVLLRPGLIIAQFVFEELVSMPSETLLYKNKKNAVYKGETEFRGSKLGADVWTDEMKKAIQGMRENLKKR